MFLWLPYQFIRSPQWAPSILWTNHAPLLSILWLPLYPTHYTLCLFYCLPRSHKLSYLFLTFICSHFLFRVLFLKLRSNTNIGFVSKWEIRFEVIYVSFCNCWWKILTRNVILYSFLETECPHIDDASEKHQESKDNFLNSVLFTFNKILTMERLHGYNMSTSLNPTRKRSYKCKSYGKSLQPTLLESN